MIRTNADSEEPTNEEQVVTMNEDKTKTEYPEQVQELLNEFSDVFPKELPTGLPL